MRSLLRLFEDADDYYVRQGFPNETLHAVADLFRETQRLNRQTWHAEDYSVYENMDNLIVNISNWKNDVHGGYTYYEIMDHLSSTQMNLEFRDQFAFHVEDLFTEVMPTGAAWSEYAWLEIPMVVWNGSMIDRIDVTYHHCCAFGCK